MPPAASSAVRRVSMQPPAAAATLDLCEFLLDRLFGGQFLELRFERTVADIDQIGIGFHLVDLAFDLAVAAHCLVDLVDLDARTHRDALFGGFATDDERAMFRLRLVQFRLQLLEVFLAADRDLLDRLQGLAAAVDLAFGALLGGEGATGEVFTPLFHGELGLGCPVEAGLLELRDVALVFLLVRHRAGRGGADLDEAVFHFLDDQAGDLLGILRLVEHRVDVRVDDVGKTGENAHIRTFRRTFSGDGLLGVGGLVPMKRWLGRSEEDARDQEAGDKETPAFERSTAHPASKTSQWAGLLVGIAVVGVAHL